MASLRRGTELTTLEVVPSGPDLYGVDVELIGREDRFDLLRKSLAPMVDEYDTILIDCPPSLGLLTLNAMSAARSVLIPMQCEYYALEGLSQLTRTLEMVRAGPNPDLEVEGVLLTMFDGRNNLASHQVAKATETPSSWSSNQLGP